MANPKNISSYDPRLVQIIETIASSSQPKRVPIPLQSHSAAITFGSRFSTLKKLLSEEAIKQNNPALASQIRGCCLRAYEKTPNEKGELRPTGWYVCNSAGGADQQLSQVLSEAVNQLALDEMTSAPVEPEPEQPQPSQEVDADEEDSFLKSMYNYSLKPDSDENEDK